MNLKAWQINEYDIWVAPTKEQAVQDAMIESGTARNDYYSADKIRELSEDELFAKKMWIAEPPEYTHPKYDEIKKECYLSLKHCMDTVIENGETSFLLCSTMQ